MRITKIEIAQAGILTDPKLKITFINGGIEIGLTLHESTDWPEMTRPEKISWCKTQVQQHLLENTYIDPGTLIFPDASISEMAANDFESMPNWAVWSATEAEDFIHNSVFNGGDLATVQAQIDALPNTVTGMKTGLKSAAAAIVQLRNNQERIAQAIVYLRDRTIPK